MSATTQSKRSKQVYNRIVNQGPYPCKYCGREFDHPAHTGHHEKSCRGGHEPAEPDALLHAAAELTAATQRYEEAKRHLLSILNLN